MKVIKARLIIRDYLDPSLDVHGGVLVTDGARIHAIHNDTVQVHTGDVIDLSECVLAPGLMDSHVHLAFDGSGEPVAHMRERTVDARADQVALAAKQLLASGVTYARDLGAPSEVAIELRNAVSDGTLIGPTIHSAGRPLTRPKGHCWFMGVEVADVSMAKRAVADEVQRGADLIKLMVTGGRMTPGTDPHKVELPPEVIAAAVEEAHTLGRPVTAHALSTVGVIAAADAGVDCIEHATLIGSDPTAKQITREDADAQKMAIGMVAGKGIAVSPTFSLPTSGAHPVDPSMRAGWIAAYRDAGATVVAGTDSGIDHHPHHASVLAGLRGLVSSGLSNAEALATASHQGMLALGRVRAGVLQPGFSADFIALGADPRQDLETLTRLDAVMTAGNAYRVGGTPDDQLLDPV